jgi:hypothetical protein
MFTWQWFGYHPHPTTLGLLPLDNVENEQIFTCTKSYEELGIVKICGHTAHAYSFHAELGSGPCMLCSSGQYSQLAYSIGTDFRRVYLS